MLNINLPRQHFHVPDKKLRFAHFRAPRRVAFEADSPDHHSRHGSSAEGEAARYAHLCFVAGEVRDIVVERVGGRINGRLSLPVDGAVEFPFRPKLVRGHRPVAQHNEHVRLHYVIEGHACTASTTARQPDPNGPWLVALPKRVRIGCDRITARHRTPRGWRFEPRGHGTLDMMGTVAVVDISVSGAALALAHDHMLEPGAQLVGDLVGPRGQRFHLMAQVRNLREVVDGEHVQRVGGVEFHGVGTKHSARLAGLVRSIRHRGRADAPAV
jgi:hypothetical protein